MAIELLPRPAIKYISKQGKKDLVGAEIGVLHGFNAENILQTLPIKKLYLIDSYECYPEYLDIKTPVFSRVRKDAEKRLAPFADKVEWIIKKSVDALFDILNNLDFVYIDGNHAYRYAAQDIYNYWPKVKKGGVLCGHDYYNTTKAREVKKAVDEFVAEKNLKLYHIFGGGLCDWWIVK